MAKPEENVGGASGGDRDGWLLSRSPPEAPPTFSSQHATTGQPLTSRIFSITNVLVNMARESSSGRLRIHRKQGPGIFFITKCLEPKKPAISAKESRIIVSTFQYYVERNCIEVGAFSIVPDHWHLLFALKELTLSNWMHNLMSFVGAKTGAALKMRGTRWQDGFYDVGVGSKKQFDFVADYIEANPIRRTLVARAEDWEFSSAYARHRKWVTLVWEF